MAKVAQLTTIKTFNHPIDKVWETVAVNYGQVYQYMPGVKASDFIGEMRACAGTQRHCDFDKKGWIKEEITDWKEKESFSLKMIDSSMPMKMMTSTFHFKEEGNNTTLRQEFNFQMGGIMGLFTGMMKGKMQKMLDDGMKSLDQHLSK